MTAPLTGDRVLALAPDAAAAKAGTALATPRVWARLAGDGRALWGECKGSGAQPYQTRVALDDLASRCSCPSRKFPCKHALGLLLLFAAHPELFVAAEPPAWVAEWLATRSDRAERRAAPARAEAPPDAAAQARRAAAREGKVGAGMEELGRWLRDLVRAGIAEAPARPAAFWETMAARLVDAQAPGAARLVRQLAVVPGTGDGWPERMLVQLGRLHLLAESYRRLDALPDALRATVRARLGFPVADAELAAEPGVADRWTVVGQVVDEEDRLRARRTWLRGAATGRDALLLDFAHGTAPFAETLPPPGTALDAELVFHPGAFAQRAAVRSGGAAAAAPLPAGDDTLAAATLGYARALAGDPWTERVPVVLAAVVPEREGGRWVVRDGAGDAAAVSPRFRGGWALLALSGGHPLRLAAEWDGASLLPLAAGSAGGATVPLAGVGVAA